jgi:hypothetical protein
MHRSVHDWVAMIMEARTTQVFTGAFNALLKQECPHRKLRLVVITPEYNGDDDDADRNGSRRRSDLWRSDQLKLCTYLKRDPRKVKTNDTLGLYLVDGTVCAASIEVEIGKDFVGSIYAKTIKSHRSLDMYNLLVAATMIYTAFMFRVVQLHSFAIETASMWVLRPYTWLSPSQQEFDKKRNNSYDRYNDYVWSRDEVGVNVFIRPRDNVQAAGEVLAQLFRTKKFCQSRPAAADGVDFIDLTRDVVDLRGGFGTLQRKTRRTRRASRRARARVRR